MDCPLNVIPAYVMHLPELPVCLEAAIYIILPMPMYNYGVYSGCM